MSEYFLHGEQLAVSFSMLFLMLFHQYLHLAVMYIFSLPAWEEWRVESIESLAEDGTMRQEPSSTISSLPMSSLIREMSFHLPENFLAG